MGVSLSSKVIYKAPLPTCNCVFVTACLETSVSLSFSVLQLQEQNSASLALVEKWKGHPVASLMDKWEPAWSSCSQLHFPTIRRTKSQCTAVRLQSDRLVLPAALVWHGCCWRPLQLQTQWKKGKARIYDHQYHKRTVIPLRWTMISVLSVKLLFGEVQEVFVVKRLITNSWHPCLHPVFPGN